MMHSEDKLFAITWTLVAIVALVGIGAGVYSCNRNDERRVECVKAGGEPRACRDLFKTGGG